MICSQRELGLIWDPNSRFNKVAMVEADHGTLAIRRSMVRMSPATNLQQRLNSAISAKAALP